MSDLISRQAAIDALHMHLMYRMGTDSNKKRLDEWINNLPSAQPEYYDYSDIEPLWKSFAEENDINLTSTAKQLKDAMWVGYRKGEQAAQTEIIRCKDCKHWRQQTNYQGAPLSFGFCESDDMWRSLYGETYEVSHIDTDDDFYCGYAERRTDESDK